MRDSLIELFDREFVETQEEVGIDVIGQFRDTDHPDRFVWLRGFADMEARRRALTAFYVDGEAWRKHREAARSTMVDTTDVLLLRPELPGGGLHADRRARPPRDAITPPPRRVVAIVWAFDRTVVPDDVSRVARAHELAAAEVSAKALATLVTEHSANTYPALPVREGENVVAWFAGVADQAAADRLRTRIRSLGIAARVESLSLAPTARSRLAG